MSINQSQDTAVYLFNLDSFTGKFCLLYYQGLAAERLWSMTLHGEEEVITNVVPKRPLGQ